MNADTAARWAERRRKVAESIACGSADAQASAFQVVSNQTVHDPTRRQRGLVTEKGLVCGGRWSDWTRRQMSECGTVVTEEKNVDFGSRIERNVTTDGTDFHLPKISLVFIFQQSKM